MLFSLSAVTAVLAMATSAAAQQPGFDPITSPSRGQQVPAGQPFEIQWTCPPQYEGVTVKIVLIGGETQNGQEPRQDITASVPNSARKFTWNVPNHPPRPFYGLKIMDVNNATLMQYSEPFVIVGGSASVSSSAPITSTASSAPYATPKVTSVSAPAVPTGVAPQAKAPVSCGSGVGNGSAPATPAAGSNAGAPGSNAGAPGPNAGAPGSNAGAPGSKNVASPSGAPSNNYPGSNGASTGPVGGVSSSPNNSTIPMTAAAPAVRAGLVGVIGAVAAVAISL